MYGCYEKHICYFLRDVALLRGGAKSCIFADVGGNKGHHSIFVSSYVKMVHAFEPYEPVANEFQYLVDQGLIKNIILNRFGLSDEAAILRFYPPSEDNQGVGSFSGELQINDGEASISLEVRTGDQYFETELPDVIKVDVEGFEARAFAGLKLTLERSRPIVCFEEKSMEVFPLAEYQRLFPEGYTFFAFVQKSRKHIKRQRTYGEWTLTKISQPRSVSADDFVALPNETFLSDIPDEFSSKDFDLLFVGH